MDSYRNVAFYCVTMIGFCRKEGEGGRNGREECDWSICIMDVCETFQEQIQLMIKNKGFLHWSWHVLWSTKVAVGWGQRLHHLELGWLLTRMVSEGIRKCSKVP